MSCTCDDQGTPCKECCPKVFLHGYVGMVVDAMGEEAIEMDSRCRVVVYPREDDVPWVGSRTRISAVQIVETKA